MSNRFKIVLRRLGLIARIDDITRMERVDRDAYKYIEGDHALLVQVELLSVNPGRVIYPGTIKRWLPPHDAEVITRGDKERIVKKICTYFDNLGWTYKVQ